MHFHAGEVLTPESGNLKLMLQDFKCSKERIYEPNQRHILKIKNSKAPENPKVSNNVFFIKNVDTKALAFLIKVLELKYTNQRCLKNTLL